MGQHPPTHHREIEAMTDQLAKPKRVRRRVKPLAANVAKRIDGRTREARMLKQLRDELIAHVGGKPSVPERILIDTAARLQWHIALMDQKLIINGNEMNPLDARRYTAWCNALGRALMRLGLKSPAERGPDLASYLAQKAASSGTAS